MQEHQPSRLDRREARNIAHTGQQKQAQTAATGELASAAPDGDTETEQEAGLGMEQEELATPPTPTIPTPVEPAETAATDPANKARGRSVFSRQKRRTVPTSLRASLAVVGGRTAGALSRRLRLGGGASIAGVVAQRLYPDIVEHLSTQLQQGSILVTGTNGKTTTSGFIAAILRDAGLRVWRNREGSNLMGGIAGALVIRTQPNGRLRRSGQAISIFEVDEAVMPRATQTIAARAAVFTNLFRDQLDRYGEVDTVLERWKQSIKQLSPETVLILNADDPAIAELGQNFAGRVIYFGIEGQSLDEQQTAEGEHQVIDTRSCPQCGGEYSYTRRFYSHIGHYACPNCAHARPTPTIYATNITSEGFDRLRLKVTAGEFQGEIIVPLPGLYNIYNALAAIATAHALEIASEPIVSGIEQFKPAFGRGERLQVAGRTVRMLLAKNPTGFNEVLRTLCTGGGKRHVLFVLNDNIADGKDISWIWDIDFEQALDYLATVSITGTRARDLALRLKYAGLSLEEITLVPISPLRAERKEGRERGAAPARKRSRPGKRGADVEQAAAPPASSLGRPYGLAKALDLAVEQTPEGETLFIVPTYTGLLEIHRELERRGLTPHYWEETGP